MESPGKKNLFSKRKFFLDIKDIVLRKKLAYNLENLGAKEEVCLNKNVSFIVSDNKDYFKTDLQSAAVPSSKSNSSFKFSPLAFSPVTNSPLGDQNSCMPLSRTQNLLLKAREKYSQVTGTKNIMEICKQYNIKVFSVKKALSQISWSKKYCKYPNDKKQVIQSVNAQKINPPFIKFEDMTRCYRPKFHSWSLTSWQDMLETPLLRCVSKLVRDVKQHGNVNELVKSRPVLREVFHQNNKPRIQSFQSERASVTKLTSEILSNLSSRLIPVAKPCKQYEPPPRKKAKLDKKAKRHYCVICKEHFTDREKHLQKQSHVRFQENESNYKSVQEIMSSLPQPADFIASVKRKDQCSRNATRKEQGNIIVTQQLVGNIPQSDDSETTEIAPECQEAEYPTAADIQEAEYPVAADIQEAEYLKAADIQAAEFLLNDDVISPSCSSPETHLPYLEHTETCNALKDKMEFYGHIGSTYPVNNHDFNTNGNDKNTGIAVSSHNFAEYQFPGMCGNRADTSYCTNNPLLLYDNTLRYLGEENNSIYSNNISNNCYVGSSDTVLMKSINSNYNHVIDSFSHSYVSNIDILDHPKSAFIKQYPTANDQEVLDLSMNHYKKPSAHYNFSSVEDLVLRENVMKKRDESIVIEKNMKNSNYDDSCGVITTTKNVTDQAVPNDLIDVCSNSSNIADQVSPIIVNVMGADSTQILYTPFISNDNPAMKISNIMQVSNDSLNCNECPKLILDQVNCNNSCTANSDDRTEIYSSISESDSEIHTVIEECLSTMDKSLENDNVDSPVEKCDNNSHANFLNLASSDLPSTEALGKFGSSESHSKRIEPLNEINIVEEPVILESSPKSHMPCWKKEMKKKYLHSVDSDESCQSNEIPKKQFQVDKGDESEMSVHTSPVTALFQTENMAGIFESSRKPVDELNEQSVITLNHGEHRQAENSVSYRSHENSCIEGNFENCSDKYEVNYLLDNLPKEFDPDNVYVIHDEVGETDDCTISNLPNKYFQRKVTFKSTCAYSSDIGTIKASEHENTENIFHERQCLDINVKVMIEDKVVYPHIGTDFETKALDAVTNLLQGSFTDKVCVQEDNQSHENKAMHNFIDGSIMPKVYLKGEYKSASNETGCNLNKDL